VQRICSEVSEFIISADFGDFYELVKINELQDFVVHKELRDRFDSIWTHQDGNKVRVFVNQTSNKIQNLIIFLF
jgi:hypothetical protein